MSLKISWRSPMKTRVIDMTIDELKLIIHETVQESFDELVEDITALLSPEYLNSIEAARKDFQEGNFKNFEDIFNVYP
jgi:hypothetical protein